MGPQVRIWHASVLRRFPVELARDSTLQRKLEALQLTLHGSFQVTLIEPQLLLHLQLQFPLSLLKLQMVVALKLVSLSGHLTLDL